MTKQELDVEVKKCLNPTIDNAIRNMKIAKLFFLTKDGKFDSSIVNKYMKDKEKFLPFIKEEERERFMSEYSQVFQEVGTEPDTYIAWRLLNWEHSGDIMMLLNENTDWNIVDKTLHLQGHSGGTMSCLTNKILYFSPYGLDFVEHVYGFKCRKQAEKDMKKIEKRKASKKSNSKN